MEARARLRAGCGICLRFPPLIPHLYFLLLARSQINKSFFIKKKYLIFAGCLGGAGMQHIDHAENKFSPSLEGIWDWYLNLLKFTSFFFFCAVFLHPVLDTGPPFPKIWILFSPSFKPETSENKFKHTVVKASLPAFTF